MNDQHMLTFNAHHHPFLQYSSGRTPGCANAWPGCAVAMALKAKGRYVEIQVRACFLPLGVAPPSTTILGEDYLTQPRFDGAFFSWIAPRCASRRAPVAHIGDDTIVKATAAQGL